MRRPAEVVIGKVVGITASGAPLVDFADNPVGTPLAALATACYDESHRGAAVALMFVNGERKRPLVLGVLAQADAAPGLPEGENEQLRQTVTMTAVREIVLQCGRARIVLTRAGKVLVQGTHLSLRSSGMHRITGASVQIN
jgi:hypothetical protein